jgi:MFS family permease
VRSRLFVLLCLGYLATTAFEFLLAAAMPTIADDLSISFGRQGMLFLTVSASEALANVATGWWRDRTSTRLLGVISLSLAAAGCAVVAIWPAYTAMLIGQGAIGAGAGAFFAVAAPGVAELAGAERRGTAFGIWGAAVSIGGVWAAVLAATTVLVSWRWTYAGLAGAGVALAIAFSVLVQRTSPPASVRTRLRPLLTSGTFLRLTGLGMVATAAQVGVTAFLAVYAVEYGSFSAGVAAAIVAAGRLASLPSKVVVGRIGDQFGRPRTLHFVFVGTAICELAFLTGHRVLVIAGITAYIAVAGSIFPLVNALMGDWLAAGTLGSGYGIFRAVQIAFGGAVALTIGLMSDVAGLRVSLMVGLITLTCGVVILRGMEPAKVSEASRLTPQPGTR